MPGVTPNPMPLYLMSRRRLVQAPPEILVLHRFLVSRFPTLAFPGVDPLGNALLDVLRIGMEPDPARALERLEGADHRHELHAVVGRRRLAATGLFFLILVSKNKTPSSRPGIPPAGAVGKDFHELIAHGACAFAATPARRPRGGGRAPSARPASRAACPAPASRPGPRRFRPRSATIAPRLSP